MEGVAEVSEEEWWERSLLCHTLQYKEEAERTFSEARPMEEAEKRTGWQS